MGVTMIPNGSGGFNYIPTSSSSADDSEQEDLNKINRKAKKYSDDKKLQEAFVDGAVYWKDQDADFTFENVVGFVISILFLTAIVFWICAFINGWSEYDRYVDAKYTDNFSKTAETFEYKYDTVAKYLGFTYGLGAYAGYYTNKKIK